MNNFFKEKILMGQDLGPYLKSQLTPFNLFVTPCILLGLALLVFRFYAGLGATTNLSQFQPWGLWIGFDMMTGIALAAGGFTIGAAVEIFDLKEYHSIERPAILTGFLGYLMAVFGLIADLGKPWNMVGIFSNNGTQSVLFEVAWCVCCYTTVLFLEFGVPLFEWLKWERFYKPLKKSLLALTVLSVMFSTMHQSALGSLFIIAPGKLHPLWYSESMFFFFFVSAVIAGISMVIVESTISHRVFHSQIKGSKQDANKLMFGLAKAGAVALFAYFFLKLQGVIDNHAIEYIGVGFYGKWWIVEMVWFILTPAFLFAWGARNERIFAVKMAGLLGVAGVVLNRLNISMIAYNWNQAERYWPSWQEYWVSITLVLIGIVAFRWVVNRMPILVSHDV